MSGRPGLSYILLSNRDLGPRRRSGPRPGKGRQ